MDDLEVSLFLETPKYEKAHMIAYRGSRGQGSKPPQDSFNGYMYPPQNDHISPSNGTFESMMFPTSLSVGMCIRFLEGI